MFPLMVMICERFRLLTMKENRERLKMIIEVYSPDNREMLMTCKRIALVDLEA